MVGVGSHHKWFSEELFIGKFSDSLESDAAELLAQTKSRLWSRMPSRSYEGLAARIEFTNELVHKLRQPLRVRLGCYQLGELSPLFFVNAKVFSIIHSMS